MPLSRFATAVLRSVALYVGFVVAWQFSMFVNLLIVPVVPWMLVMAAAAWWYLANWAISGKWNDFAPQSESNWIAWTFVLSTSALAVLIFPLQGFVTGIREHLPVPAPAGVSPMFARCFVIMAPVYFGMVEEVAFRGVLQRPSSAASASPAVYLSLPHCSLYGTCLWLSSSTSTLATQSWPFPSGSWQLPAAP